MQRVNSHEELDKVEGNTTVGPIPAGVQPDEWLQAIHPEATHYFYIVYDKVMVNREGEAQYARQQGSYYMKNAVCDGEHLRKELSMVPTESRHLMPDARAKYHRKLAAHGLVAEIWFGTKEKDGNGWPVENGVLFLTASGVFMERYGEPREADNPLDTMKPIESDFFTKYELTTRVTTFEDAQDDLRFKFNSEAREKIKEYVKDKDPALTILNLFENDSLHLLLGDTGGMPEDLSEIDFDFLNRKFE